MYNECVKNAADGDFFTILKSKFVEFHCYGELGGIWINTCAYKNDKK